MQIAGETALAAGAAVVYGVEQVARSPAAAGFRAAKLSACHLGTTNMRESR
jgi:hypothetical protein